MPLRCLLFSSDEGLAPPIWQVLADLGIEGEYCGNAVEAVERVTTQLFQIVITDWDDQPEAGFLLKTARELKAANRPLTLAIVKEDSHLPLALQAGANSILRKPLVSEQVRDTLGTAYDLLRAKLESSAPVARQATAAPAPSAFAAAAAAPAVSPVSPAPAPVSAPASVTQGPEKAFRPGEFLQPASSGPGKQFDTGSDEAKSAERAAAAQVDPLNELEPMAAAVEAVQEEPPEEEATGWASVKARLARLRQQPMSPPSPAAKPELLSYENTPSQVAPAGHVEESDPPKPAAGDNSRPETKAEAQLFAYIAGESTKEPEPEVANAPNRMGRLLVVGALAAAAVVAVVKIPPAKQGLGKLYASVVHVGRSWLNPPPVSTPQAPPQHESFGQAGDEYKLPVATNIPDATTDPSQIRVLPVVDPTAKPGTNSATNAATTQSPAAQSGASTPDQNQTGTGQVTEQTGQNPAASVQPAADQPAGAGASTTTPLPPQVQTRPPVQVENLTPRPETAPVQSAPQPRPVSATSNAGIPSSLKSQMASMTPEASGTKPAEAALPSIQPVELPESAARGLLLQQVDAAYPESAKNSRQQGSVVLQVLIAADGTVQDAKFLQGSLVFARSAIDAVRQWHFKPYLLNGRPASVQTVLTLSFRPPAS